MLLMVIILIIAGTSAVGSTVQGGAVIWRVFRHGFAFGVWTRDRSGIRTGNRTGNRAGFMFTINHVVIYCVSMVCVVVVCNIIAVSDAVLREITAGKPRTNSVSGAMHVIQFNYRVIVSDHVITHMFACVTLKTLVHVFGNEHLRDILIVRVLVVDTRARRIVPSVAWVTKMEVVRSLFWPSAD